MQLLAGQRTFGLVILGQLFSEQATEWLARLLHRTSAIPVALMYSGEANRIRLLLTDLPTGDRLVGYCSIA